jgi:hypothetical protein
MRATEVAGGEDPSAPPSTKKELSALQALPRFMGLTDFELDAERSRQMMRPLRPIETLAGKPAAG